MKLQGGGCRMEKSLYPEPFWGWIQPRHLPGVYEKTLSRWDLKKGCRGNWGCFPILPKRAFQ